MQENIQAFVDDSHSIMIRDPSDTTPLSTIIQHNMQLWEELLYTIGGKLEITKCRYIRFENAANTQPRQETPRIAITDHETSTEMIPDELHHSEAYKLLGIHMAFDGC
jgi:hypothetical protein